REEPRIRAAQRGAQAALSVLRGRAHAAPARSTRSRSATASHPRGARTRAARDRGAPHRPRRPHVPRRGDPVGARVSGHAEEVVSTKNEWLNLLEVSGPFLAVPVLREVFPQGLEELDASRAKRLRGAYEEWRDADDGDDAELDELHTAWIDEVLRTALEADEQVLKAGKDVPASVVELPEHATTIAPELVFVNPTHGGA